MRLEMFAQPLPPPLQAKAVRIEQRLGFVPDPLRLFAYRPDFFPPPDGAAHLASSATWTRSERELFAAFVSVQNHCVF